ncbi:MAG: divergent polysaccharide deacetylase family protein [Firmicutes bacterium]|nr:divergent polysaccharide deacetylase family protein [Bacillota bacterium]
MDSPASRETKPRASAGLAAAGFFVFALIIGGSVAFMAGWAQTAAIEAWAPGPAGPAAESFWSASHGSPGASSPSLPRPRPEGRQPARSTPAEGRPAGDAPTGERPTEETPAHEPPVAGQASPNRRRFPEIPAGPVIAVVIDDWGYAWPAAGDFLRFPEPLTVAVLPHLPLSEDHARQAAEAGFEVILHMPMEAENQAMDIGPGGIYTSMDDETIAGAVRSALAALPGVRGLNNHMGSRATSDPRVMGAVLGVLAERGLFYLDSFTSRATVGPDVAEAAGVPYAVNQVFLDHINEPDHIRRQIRRLVRLSLEQGAAVGIGHVRPQTYEALMDMLPEIRASGVRFVTVSQLLDLRAVQGAAAPAAGRPGDREVPVPR